MNQNRGYTSDGLFAKEDRNTNLVGNSRSLLSSECLLLNEDDTHTTRPTTNQTSRYDAFSLSNPSSSIYFPSIPSIREKFSSSSQTHSNALYNRICKLQKAEKKLIKQKQELIKDLNSWSNALPNDDSKTLMYHFITILETEISSHDILMTKKDLINSQLFNISKREKNLNDQTTKRNKLLVKLKDQENKSAESQETVLSKESLDVADVTLGLVEDQFIRSINHGLKSSILEYILGLRDSGILFSDNTRIFLDSYYFTSNKLGPSSNMYRMILQNKLSNSVTTPSSAPQSRKFNERSTQHQKLDDEVDLENDEEEKEKDQHLEGISDEFGETSNRVPTILRISTRDYNPLLNTNIIESPANQLKLNKTEGQGLDGNYNPTLLSTPGSLSMRPLSQSLGATHYAWNNS